MQLSSWTFGHVSHVIIVTVRVVRPVCLCGRVDSIRLTLDFAPSDVPYHLRRPVFCCRWPTSVELPANRTKTIWQSCPVQSAIKDSFVWVMGPQRFVTLTSCKLVLHYRNILTYLLTFVLSVQCSGKWADNLHVTVTCQTIIVLL